MTASKDRLAAAAPAPLPQPGAGFAPVPAPPRPADEPVTAGVVDDNADFGSYLAYRQRRAQSGTLGARFPMLDVSVRHRLTVHDAAGRPVPDAIVSAHLNHVPVALWARTDAAGRTWLHPAAAGVAGQPLVVRVEAPTPHGMARGSALLRPGQRDALQITLDRAVPAAPTRLDLVFLVDATGSMGDEIDKLKRSLRSIAAQIARMPQAPDVCWGLVAYRDRGDAFFVRTWDFTDRLDAFQDVLDRLQAAAGGDMPEALNEGLHAAVHRMSWRGDGATRMALLVADAPPHLPGEGPAEVDGDGQVRLDHDTMAAQAQGIKLMTLGASGLDARGEFAFRQMAQYTGGRFVFLTYAQADDPSSGPGRQTSHEVEGYSVESLDRLIVRLVREELDARPRP
jgi:Mg-chelatase subunit ChlD